MNLLFAINGGYIPTFLGCMRSVLLHGGASHYEVFILHSDLTDGDEADIRTALPDVDFHFVFVDPAMFDGFPESKRYPRQIYYRIAAPLLLPDTLERILYLDADTVIINPLTTLYATPFGDAYFMACTHTRCMRSVLLHGGASHYEVFILHSDLTDGDEADIRTALPDVDFHFVFVDPAMFDGFPESKRYPRQIYYRIAAPLLLPDTLERILYLDADTVIINPLTTLYATPFGDAYFMACTHTRKLLEKLNAARLGMDEAAPYINTGVLLYNLPALRADLDMERVRAFADEKQDVFLLPDQDILTALYGDRVHLLDSMVYNLSDRILALHNAELRNAPVDLDWVRAHTVIIHYCGRLKPWKPHYVGVLDVFYHELMEEIQK